MAGTARDRALKKIKRPERNAICKVENEDRVWIAGMLSQSTTRRVTVPWKIAKSARAIAARIANDLSAICNKDVSMRIKCPGAASCLQLTHDAGLHVPYK